MKQVKYKIHEIISDQMIDRMWYQSCKIYHMPPTSQEQWWLNLDGIINTLNFKK